MDAILGLIERIYQAGAQPEQWQETLTHLADASGSVDATLGMQTPAHVQIALSTRTDPDYVRTYGEYYHARNPMQQATHARPIGQVVLDRMILDVEHFQNSEFFNEWCRPQGFLTGGAISLAASGGWRAMVMVSGPTDYDATQVNLLNAIAPHLCRAFQLNQVLHEARALGLGGMAALEQVDKGAFVVDRDGQARALNAVAERILGLNDGLALRDGRLMASLATESAAIGRALSLCEWGSLDAAGGTVTITRSSGRSPLSLLCMRYPAGPHWGGFGQHLALVFVTDPDSRLEHQALRLRQRYGLTPAEAALALEIARTGGRQDAALNRGISVATARSQLTSIFDKTGVRRQAELVRLLLDDQPHASVRE